MNRLALKRILASMIAMAGLAALLPSPLRGGSIGEAERGGGNTSNTRTLTRSLRLAVLRILRPAEAAARRLVIALAPTLPPMPARAERASPVTRPAILSGRPGLRRGTGIIMGPAGPTAVSGAPAHASFRMLDPLRQPFRPRRRWVRQVAVPRISGLGPDDRRTTIKVRPLPSPADAVHAAPLARRLAALGRALDGLPARARRFALWRARAQGLRAAGRAVRVWPLKTGRPPGGRLFSYDPDRRQSRRIREVDEVLAHSHSLALYALRPPDSW